MAASRFLDSRRLKLTLIAGLILRLESPLIASDDSRSLIQSDLDAMLHL
jgi:hypothetical protein